MRLMSLRPAAGGAAVFAMLLFSPALVFASVAGEVNKANALYRQGKFDDSIGLYQKAEDRDHKSPVIKYDLGTALYKKGDYEGSLEYLQEAAADKDIKLRSKAEYNLGNVLYKSGIQKEKTNVDAAIKSLQEALARYGQTLADEPKDGDALFNQDFVKKEIERLKQKKQQQQRNQQQQQKQDQQRKDQKDQQSQGAKQKPQESRQAQQSKPKDQKDKPSASSESQAQKQQNEKSRAEEGQKEFDRKEAQDQLEEYRENEEPKKLLNYRPKKIDDRPVLKDW